MNIKSTIISSTVNKIALLDNNFLEFCLQLKRKDIQVEKIFSFYDLILIPTWVYEEISDSLLRQQFIEDLKKCSISIIQIDESQYGELVDNQELFIFEIFDKLCLTFPQIKGYMRKHILKNNQAMDMDYTYEEWINKLYSEWPIPGDTLSNGRVQKKNAGEISLLLLGFLLSSKIDENTKITILSYDNDCFSCFDTVRERLQRDKNHDLLARINYQFSFKSNDALIFELYHRQMIDKCLLAELVEKRLPRRLKYSIRHDDYSHNEVYTKIENDKFLQLVENSNLNIIF